MRSSYAVTWRGRDGGHCAGSLVLAPAALSLEGRGPTGTAAREVAYETLRGVRIGREPVERIAGRLTLVLDLAGGDRIQIAGLAELGVVSELAERLGAAAFAWRDRP